jgi:hypothetical protein
MYAGGTAASDIAASLEVKDESTNGQYLYICFQQHAPSAGAPGTCVQIKNSDTSWHKITIETQDSPTGSFKQYRTKTDTGDFSAWADSTSFGGTPMPNGGTYNYVWLIVQNSTSVGTRIYVDQLQDEISDVTATRIVSIFSPAQGSVQTNNNVPFNFTYWYNDSASSTPYDTIGVQIQDNTVSQTIQGPTEPITATGGATFSEHKALPDGHSYTWTPYFFDTASSSQLLGPAINFSINTTATTTVTGLPAGLQTLWNMIQNNPPFGFIFQVRAQINNLSATSTAPAATLRVADSIRTKIINPLDVGLSSVVFLFFLRWLYFRMKHFEF